MDDATFGKQPRLLDDDDTNRLCQAALAYQEAQHGEHGSSVDPRLGFSLQISYSPRKGKSWQIAQYQQDEFVRGVGVGACLMATVERIRLACRVGLYRAKGLVRHG